MRSARDSQSIEASSDNPTRERKPTQFSNSYYGSTLLTSRVLYSVNVINNSVDDTAASTQMALSPEPSTTPASQSIHHRLLHPSCSASYILTTDTARMMRLELGGLQATGQTEIDLSTLLIWLPSALAYTGTSTGRTSGW